MRAIKLDSVIALYSTAWSQGICRIILLNGFRGDSSVCVGLNLKLVDARINLDLYGMV